MEATSIYSDTVVRRRGKRSGRNSLDTDVSLIDMDQMRISSRQTSNYSQSRRSHHLPSLLSILLLTLTLLLPQPASAQHPISAADNGPPDTHLKQTTNNITDSAPLCANFCYPFDPTYFSTGTIPCESHKTTNGTYSEKYIPCLCTDRPFARFLADCIMRKCGPAIPSAIEYAYRTCDAHGVNFPPPKEVIEILNITLPNEAIAVPEEVEGMRGGFVEEYPEPLYGASKSDDDPGLTRNLSLSQTSGGVERMLGGEGVVGRFVGGLGLVGMVVVVMVSGVGLL